MKRALKLATGIFGLLLMLSAWGIISYSGFGRMAPIKAFDWRYAAVGLPIFAVGGFLFHRTFGPALRFRLPKN